MIFGVLTTCNNTPRSPDAIPCDFFLWSYVKDQVYVPPLPASILELKVVTSYKQFGTNSIIVLMFVESQRVHILSTCKVCNKNLECFSSKQKKIRILLSQVYCVWQVVKTPTIILNHPVFSCDIFMYLINYKNYCQHTSLLFNGHRLRVRGQSGRILKLIIHFHLVSRLRVSGAVPLLPLYAFTSCTAEILYLRFYFYKSDQWKCS